MSNDVDIKQVDVHFDEFSVLEGFRSARECLEEINGLVSKDEADRRRLMKDLQVKLRLAQAQWSKRCQLEAGESTVAHRKPENKTEEDSKAEDKRVRPPALMGEKDSADEEKAADNIDEGIELPVMLFFQPISMDAMLSQVLSLTEYSTFSMIMRAKVKQKKLLRVMREKVALQSAETRRRREDLGFHDLDHGATVLGTLHADCTATHRYSSERQVPTDVIISEFESLVYRICELTPNEKVIIDETRSALKALMWRQIVLGEVRDADAKGSDWTRHTTESRKILFQKLIMNTAMCLWRLCSFEQQFVIRSHINVIMPRIAAIENDTPDAENELHRAEALYLSMSHDMVDDIERQTLKALEEYEDQHEKRRKAYHSCQQK